jgi:hypothetical protein
MKAFAPATSDPIAALKLAIIRQQELAGRLFRQGDPDGARQARAKLFNMTNRLEVMEAMLPGGLSPLEMTP